MNCISSGCPATIDENQPTPMVELEGGKSVVNVQAARAIADALAKWSHVSVVAGQATVLSGHVCPDHAVALGNVSLTVGGK